MTIEEDLAVLDALQAHLFAHRHATTSIMFAGETTDPAEAAAPRAEALATLEEEVHELLCRAETGELLERLGKAAEAAGAADRRNRSYACPIVDALEFNAVGANRATGT